MNRLASLDLQVWLEGIADGVLEKRAQIGAASLNPLEQVICILWFANYCMMNAGDLANATDEDPRFLQDGAAVALELGMTETNAAFALPRDAFEKHYDDLLPKIAEEIRHRLQTNE